MMQETNTSRSPAVLTNLLHNLIGLEEARRNGRITEAEFTPRKMKKCVKRT